VAEQAVLGGAALICAATDENPDDNLVSQELGRQIKSCGERHVQQLKVMQQVYFIAFGA
jgi:hypothetical protein